MDQGPDSIRQIAQVYVDLISISDGSLAPDALAAALDLASQRAVELGAIAITAEGETVSVDPTNLVAGGMLAMRALVRIVEDQTALSHEALLAEWRESIDAEIE
jgi:hypothetical protein